MLRVASIPFGAGSGKGRKLLSGGYDRWAFYPDLGMTGGCKWAAVSSYGDDLATTISESVRDRAVRAGLQLRPDAFGKNRWRVLDGGGLWAKGIGGGLNGNPANFLVADDWVKNPDDDASPTVQRRNSDLAVLPHHLDPMRMASSWVLSSVRGMAAARVIAPAVAPRAAQAQAQEWGRKGFLRVTPA